MRIAIDIDGVCADLHKTAAQFCESVYGFTFNTNEIVEWNPTINGVKMNTIIISLFKQPNWIEKVQPIPGAKDGIKTLADNHEVFFITQRRCRNETTEWIQKHIGDYPILFARESKCVYDFDLLIDDKWDNIAEVLAIGRKAVLYSTSYNLMDGLQVISNPKYIKSTFYMVNGWEEISNLF